MKHSEKDIQVKEEIRNELKGIGKSLDSTVRAIEKLISYQVNQIQEYIKPEKKEVEIDPLKEESKLKTDKSSKTNQKQDKIPIVKGTKQAVYGDFIITPICKVQCKKQIKKKSKRIVNGEKSNERH